MPDRSLYLPRASVIEKLSERDQYALFEWHLDQIINEVDLLKSGCVTMERRTVGYHLSLLRAKWKRFNKVFAHFLDDDLQAA